MNAVSPLRLPIGIHDDVPAAAYHADPCELGPSLSSSVGRILLDDTPLHAWTKSPRLNPAFEHETDSKFDLGTVVHELILGRGGGFHIVEADGWTTKAAREQRDEARANGLAPILARQAIDAEAMAANVCEKLRDVPEARGLFEGGFVGFMNGRAERVGVWRDIGGALCRMMLDWQGPTETEIWDVKTTGVSLDDESLAKWIMNIGHDFQAAFYLRGLSQLLPDLAGRFRWRWIVVEDKPPFEVRVLEPGNELLEIGDRKAALAIEKWRRCTEANHWPGYPPTVARVESPPWATDRWIAREQTDDDALSMVPMSRPMPSQAPEILGAC